MTASCRLLASRACGDHATSSSELEVKSRAWFTSGMSTLLTISEVSRRSGVAASALRFYEQRGLIAAPANRIRPPALRSPRAQADRLHRLRPTSGARRWTRSAPSRPSCHPTALPLAETGSRLSSTWTARIDQRIHELERLRVGLTECIGCGCLSLDRCKLANPGDRAAGLGPAPLLDRRPTTGLTCRRQATGLG